MRRTWVGGYVLIFGSEIIVLLPEIAQIVLGFIAGSAKVSLILYPALVRLHLDYGG